MKWVLVSAFVLLSAVLGLAQDLTPIKLQPWRVNRRKLTLSGFSSGGTFAQQMQFSHARLFTGIAVFSHTYYGCGPGNGVEMDYDNVCTVLGKRPRDQLYDPKLALEKIQQRYADNQIENPIHIKNKKLYVYTGLRNFLFTPEMSLRILQIYEPFIQNPAMIKTRVQDAELLLPTDNFGLNCPNSASDTFFLGNCGFSGALEALRFLIGDEIAKPRAKLNLRRLLTFDQTEFFGEEPHGMDSTGFIYIPRACGSPQAAGSNSRPGRSSTTNAARRQADTECYLHFYFHGCLVTRDHVGANHTLYSGYLEVAEQNNIIVVFPQVKKGTPGNNEIGCWDTYGYTSPSFATRNGAQVQIVRRMIDRILGPDILFPENGPKAPTAARYPDRNFPTRRPLSP